MRLSSPAEGKMADDSDAPLRFLDLPSELRLMIYERLPIIITHRRIKPPDVDSHGPGADVDVAHRVLPGVILLATCRTIRAEAKDIINTKLDRIRAEPIRILAAPSFSTFFADNVHPLLAKTVRRIYNMGNANDTGLETCIVIESLRNDHLERFATRTNRMKRRQIEIAILVPTASGALPSFGVIVNTGYLVRDIRNALGFVEQSTTEDHLLDTVTIRPRLKGQEAERALQDMKTRWAHPRYTDMFQDAKKMDNEPISDEEWREHWKHGKESL